jgi:hypothetical protein
MKKPTGDLSAFLDQMHLCNNCAMFSFTHLSVVASSGNDLWVSGIVLCAHEEAGRSQGQLGLSRILCGKQSSKFKSSKFKSSKFKSSKFKSSKFKRLFTDGGDHFYWDFGQTLVSSQR